MDQVKSARAWLVFIIAALGIPYQFYLQSTPGVMVAGLYQSFGLNATQIGILTSCFFYTYLALQVPAGILVDAIGARRSLMLGIVGCVFGCALFAGAPNYSFAIAARLIMGLSASFFVPAAMVTAQSWHPVSRFAMLAGLGESIGMAGGGLGEYAMGKGMALIGWRGSMWASTVAGIVVLILIAFIVRDRRMNCEKRVEKSALRQLQEMRHCFACVVKLPKLWLIALFAALTFGPLAAFAGLWVVPYLQLRFHLHIDHAAFFGAVIFIGVAFCAPVCGFWYQRSDNKKVMLRSLTACACLLFTGILYLPMSISWIFPAMLLLGAFSCVYVLSFGLIPEVVPCHLRGAAVGLVNMGSMVIGAPILQPAIGWWLRRAPQNPEAILAHYQQSLCVLSIGLLIGLVLVSWLPVPRKQREENSFVDIMTRS